MKKNRIKAYWLLLLVLLYTAAAVLSVGETQARYVTTATWNTVVQQEAEKPNVTSDCLEDISGEPLTILLGTMPQEPYSVTFSLTAEEAASGKLTWTVDPDHISVKMCIGDNTIDQEKNIEIAAGETVEVTMILTPTETAFTEPREAIDVSVTVTWADALKGIFLTQLPAVAEGPTEEEGSDEENTGGDNTGGDNTGGDNSGGTGEDASGGTGGDSSGGTGEDASGGTGEDASGGTGEDTSGGTGEDASGGTGGDNSGGTGEDPTEATQPPVEETQPTEPITGATGLQQRAMLHKLSGRPGVVLTPNTEDPDETAPEDETTGPTTETEPVTETGPTNPDEPVGQSDEPSDPENPSGEGEDPDGSSDEDAEETTEPVQEETPGITIDANPVNSAEALPIQITAPENGGMIRLGFATVTESADSEGESQTVLDEFPKYTRFKLAEGASWFMLYHADTIALDVKAGETISVLLDLSHVELEQLQVVLGAQHQTETASISTYTTLVIPESARHTAVNSRILSVGTPLEIAVSEFWKDHSLRFTVEMLTEDEETDTVSYKPVELPEDCLLVEFTSDDTGTKLIFSIGETLPPAGTYRVSLDWIIEETPYAQSQEIFFINYLAYTESEETGGAEQ